MKPPEVLHRHCVKANGAVIDQFDSLIPSYSFEVHSLVQGQINRNLNLKSQIPGPRIKRTSGSCCISKRWIVDDSLFNNKSLKFPI